MGDLPAAPTITDDDLAVQVRTDPDAFGALYDRHFDAVYRFALRRCGHPARAEEVTAQTFYRALSWLTRHTWRAGSFRGWLLQIAMNIVRAQGIADGRSISLDEKPDAAGMLPDSTPPAEHNLFRREEDEHLWALVTALPQDQQRAVILRFAHDRSFSEIGIMLGRSEDAAKQLLYRALRTLRARLEAQGGGYE